MKKSVRNILSSVLISLAACLTLITCADPMSGVEKVIGNGGGVITVTIGGNARTTLSWANTLDSSQLTHEITVSGGQGGPHKKTIPPGGGTATFSVIPGEWTITVEAFYLGELVAKASEPKWIKKGNNPTVTIKMLEPVGYPVIDVTFDANGGSFDGVPEKIQPVKKYSRATWPEPEPTFAGKYFIDWHTDSECTDDNEYTFPAVTGEKTLYARWSDEAPFTVTFDKGHSDNEGYTEADPTIKHVLSGRTAVLPTEPTRAGYTFNGWFTSGGVAFTHETKVIENITVYAQWTANSTVNAEPPVITVQPAAINEIYHGDTIELTVTASPHASGGNLTYQWYKKANAQDNGGTSLGTENGAATATYNTPTTLGVETYYYYCVVTNTDTSVNGNPTASVTSGTAKVIVYGIGSGTEQDPFIVHNETTLKKVGTETVTGGWTLSAYYKQIKNIILDPDPGQSNWTPIGTNIGWTDWSTGDPVEYTANSFTGSYDGNGKTISNLKINASDVEYPQGLFGCIGNGYEENVGVVKNVGIVNCNITGRNIIVGGVVGENYGTVEYCYATGTVSGNYQVGGVVGVNHDYGTVQNCYVMCDVSGDDYVGGVVGENEGMVQNCYSTGDVSGTGSDSTVGGVVGYNGGDSWDKLGKVEYCYSTGTVSGNNDVGGVVGINGSYGKVEYCYSTGVVSGNNNVGGVVGVNYYIVRYCYSTGTVSGNDDVGGIAGITRENRSEGVQNCYSTGTVSGNNYVGGVVGMVDTNGHVHHCYTTGAVSGKDYVGGVAGNVSYGSVTRCVALNPSITRSGSGVKIGRVTGSYLYDSYNYANSGMMTVGWERINDEALDGVDVTLPTVESWWTNPNNWSGWGEEEWDFSSVWEWNSVTKLPKLRGVGGQ